MLLDRIVHAFPEASFAHDIVCDTESRMVVVCRVVKVAQYTWDEAVGEKQCSIAVRGCSARLQRAIAVHGCSTRLQREVAVHGCRARLQCAVAVHGCSARAIVSSEPMRAR